MCWLHPSNRMQKAGDRVCSLHVAGGLARLWCGVHLARQMFCVPLQHAGRATADHALGALLLHSACPVPSNQPEIKEGYVQTLNDTKSPEPKAIPENREEAIEEGSGPSDF